VASANEAPEPRMIAKKYAPPLLLGTSDLIWA
jgi:hypothetical protein